MSKILFFLLTVIGLQVIPATTMCPPLTSKKMIISCSLGNSTAKGNTVDCSRRVRNGTKAHLKCKPGYQVHDSVSYRTITCLENGNWSRDLFDCDPDCGRRTNYDGDAFTSEGNDEKTGDFPWHVNIYEVMPRTGHKIQVCGGTLISPQLVITAANCFWDSQSNRKNNASRYKVAAGKHHPGWDDADPGVQKRDVSDIVVHELFRGKNTNFGPDIGVLRLESPFDLSLEINLICVDWDKKLERRHLTTGTVGFVPSWEYTEDGTQTGSLRYLDLPLVDQVTCLDALPGRQKIMLSIDRICGGYENQTTEICRGDSGGGYVFAPNGSDMYFLRGILGVSLKPQDDNSICFPHQYTIFMKLYAYIEWIQDHLL